MILIQRQDGRYLLKTMNAPIHILNQLGVLTSFSVAKKITEQDINKYFSKYKKRGKSDNQIAEMLKKKIIDDIQEAIMRNEIPGLVTQEEVMKDIGLDKNIIAKLPELNKLITILSQKLADKNYDKMSLCYFINSLVNVLGLTEDDFTKFHKQNNIDEDDENDDGDDEFIDE